MPGSLKRTTSPTAVLGELEEEVVGPKERDGKAHAEFVRIVSTSGIGRGVSRPAQRTRTLNDWSSRAREFLLFIGSDAANQLKRRYCYKKHYI